ncbi:hypothetical protein N8467_01210 [bacterium]|nr:hypothetical protein [bacterium]
MKEPLELSTLETIDTGLLGYIKDELNLHTKTNRGLVKVPVLWLASERTHQIKSDRTYRDKIGKLQLPIITVERTEVNKDKAFKGSFQADLPYDKKNYKDRPHLIKSRILQEKNIPFAKNRGSKLSKGQEAYPDERFNVLQKKKVVTENFYGPFPIYVAVSYSINLRTEYQQQMNDLITPFITVTGQLNRFIFKHNNNSYEAFIDQNFAQTNNSSNLAEEERSFMTKITIKVLGYVADSGVNDNVPKVIVKENFVEVKMSREKSMLEDELPWKKKDNKYRSI